jgi:hypothetical protein
MLNIALMSSLSEDEVWTRRWEKLAVEPITNIGDLYPRREFMLVVLDWEIGILQPPGSCNSIMA